MNNVGIDDLPRTVLEHIFHFLRPYGSLDNARQVNSRWRYIIDNSVKSMKRRYSSCKDLTWHEIDEKLTHERFSPYISERGGHAACYSKSDNSMYMFGGCTARYAPLNDLWKLNLDTLEWQRISHQGDIPEPRSLCSIVDYGDFLILFGGYAKSSMNPINQRVHFFGDLYYFFKAEQKWIQVGPEQSSIKALASHAASIIQHYMVIFGGSSGEDFSNDVFIYDLNNHIWSSVHCSGDPPTARHGHCQIVLDDYNLLIIGGAGVIRGVYSDIFLLTFDQGMSTAIWRQIRVINKELWPPHFWGIRGCRVANKIVFLGRPLYADLEITKGRSRPTLSTTVSITSSSSSGQSRLSSPDSPQDRRAVAAAFSNATKESSLTESAALRRKSQFLTSRSLDEQKGNDSNGTSISRLTVQQPQSLSHNKSLELQRACSIPAIIVGEIPKLIITDDLCTSKQTQRNNSFDSGKTTNSNNVNDESTENSNKYNVNNNNNNHAKTDFRRKLCVYQLDISEVLTSHIASWQQYRVQPNAPPTLILYSLVEANGELVLFGGMKDTMNANPFLHVNSANEPGSATNCTYLLKPNYFQL